jgi:hypothetical protein
MNTPEFAANGTTHHSPEEPNNLESTSPKNKQDPNIRDEQIHLPVSGNLGPSFAKGDGPKSILKKKTGFRINKKNFDSNSIKGSSH